MRIELLECADGKCRLLDDLVRYRTVDAYFEAILNKYRNGGDLPGFVPTTCVIQDVLTGAEHNLIVDGKVCDEADETVEYTKILPDERQSFVSDLMFIVADAEKAVLCIAWVDVLLEAF